MSTKFKIYLDGALQDTLEYADNPSSVTLSNLSPATEYELVAELYSGETLLDTDTASFKTIIEYETNVFYLKNETEEENVLTLAKIGTPKTTDLGYSLNDGSTWTEFDLTQETNTVTIPAAGRLYMRSSTGLSNDFLNHISIRCSQNFSAHGNIQCLKNYKDLNNLTLDVCDFAYLFSGANTLISAKYMYLPATTLAGSCYCDMFYNCSSLTEAPTLPATTLAGSCYSYMFYGCSSLTVVPELPATTLANYCYERMFKGCSALTEAPALPATTLSGSCYYQMFQDCTSLTEAPALPATTLAVSCYNNMFNGCTSLTAAPELPATTLAVSCYQQMFQGCTALTEAQTVLPATTLVETCYASMFRGCTALKAAPELPATTLTEKCYYYMFYNCRPLQRVTTHVTKWSTYNADYWLYLAGMSANNPTIYCPADSTIPSGTGSGIPEGWTRADLVTN